MVGRERHQLDVLAGEVEALVGHRVKRIPGRQRCVAAGNNVPVFRADEIIPPDPDGLEVLHDREYRVRAFRLSSERVLIRGAVRDQKPPGVYLAG